MSHFSIAKVKVQVKNPNLLKKTVQEIIQKTNGVQVQEIYDYYGNKQTDFLIAFKNSDFPRGVGIRVNEKGEIEIKGDFYGIPNSKIEELQRGLVQGYTKNTIEFALKRMNYNIQQVSEVKGNIHITAWTWR
jgi:hypothetical protein